MSGMLSVTYKKEKKSATRFPLTSIYGSLAKSTSGAEGRYELTVTTSLFIFI